jgi:hypothetical protein
MVPPPSISKDRRVIGGREGILQSAYLETHITLRRPRRTPKRDIDLPLG